VWELSDLPSPSSSSGSDGSGGGLLQIQGPGTRDFLHNKLTANFAGDDGVVLPFQEACLLDAKGYVVDCLRVAIPDDGQTAYILTSPGHSTVELLQRLDPFVFPMDQITLTNFDASNNNNNNNNAFSFSLASTQWEHVCSAMARLQRSTKLLPPTVESSKMFPTNINDFALWKIRNDIQVLVVPSVGLPSVACVGYTFVFFGSTDAMAMGRSAYQHLIGDDNLEGPVEVGPRELETLRIQAGQPGYGHEYGRAASRDNKDSNKKDTIKTSPLELHWKSTLDLEKGCYLGQEGVASVLKNPRGPPRQLYSVVFQDDFNLYESQSRGDKSSVDNLTRLPQPGQKLYALGSNEQLMVGTLTSVGEAGGTGHRDTVALALIKRADSIQKQMKELDLVIERNNNEAEVTMSSAIIQPPPMDPLDGLEVIVEGTFTVGILRSIPTRRMKRDSNMFDDTIIVKGVDPPLRTPRPPILKEEVSADDSAEASQKEIEKAEAEAKSAAAEAKRKAEKLEMLKKRAEEAMARRQQKK
jgi:folate-binding Fe-S cluster repair protein YgfZ